MVMATDLTSSFDSKNFIPCRHRNYIYNTDENKDKIVKDLKNHTLSSISLSKGGKKQMKELFTICFEDQSDTDKRTVNLPKI